MIQGDKRDDLEAYGLLVTQYEPKMRRFLHYASDASDAEVSQVMSDSCFQVWQAMPGAKIQDSLFSQMTQTAWRTWMRKMPLLHVAKRLQAAEDAVLRLHFSGGYSLEAIAFLLGYPLGHVWACLYSGCRRRLAGKTQGTLQLVTQSYGMYRTWLVPAIEGVLPAEKSAELEDRLQIDPALSSEMDSLRQALPELPGLIGAPSALVSDMPIPPAWPDIRDRIAKTGQRSRQRQRLARWGVALGLVAFFSLLAVLNKDTLQAKDRATYATWYAGFLHAPFVAFHRLNTPQTSPLAVQLTRQANQVLREKEAAMKKPDLGARNMWQERPWTP